MPTATIKWVTQKDNNVCPICKDIDGYEWIFEDTVPDTLIHPVHGEVWNKHLGSLAHEQKLFTNRTADVPTCRCHHEDTISARDLLEKLKTKILEPLKTEYGAKP